MKNHKQRDILFALALTLGVGLLLYFLARPEETPRIVSDPLHASWWDSFNTDDQIAGTAGAPFNPDGIQLSRIHDLGVPVAGADRIEAATLASDGRLFGMARDYGTWYLFVYDSLSREITNLGIMAEQAYLYGPLLINFNRHEAYIGLSCWYDTCASHLLVYNFQSKESRHIFLSFADEDSWVRSQVITTDGLIYGMADSHLFSYDPETGKMSDLDIVGNEWSDVQQIIISTDGNLYGYTEYEGWFEYQPSTGTIIWIMEWAEYQDRRMTQDSDGKIYLLNSYNRTLYTYDPKTNTVTEIKVDWGYLSRLLGFDDHNALYGQNDRDRPDQLLRYNLDEKTSIVLENLEPGYESLVADVGGRVYLYRNKWSDDSTHLAVYEPNAFISKGVLTSTLIQPHALMVTHTVLSGGPALAWGNDGALYGVSSGVPGIIRYDPQTLESTAFISLPLASGCLRCGAQTIATDSTGRVIAGIGGTSGTRDPFAMLMTYDSEQNTVITVTIPVSGASVMRTLVTASDGSLYGSFGGYFGYSDVTLKEHLIRYDPNLSAVIDLGTPFTNTDWSTQALVVAPDGKVYGGGGPKWIVDTYYFSRAASPGSRLFVYDPAIQTFNYPGSDEVSISRVRTLLSGPDSKIYIGMEMGGEKEFQVYDPATGQWTYWDIGENGSPSIVALTWGADGLIYGSTAMHVFTYDPRHPDQPPVIIGKLNKAGFTELVAGSNGVIYGAIGSYSSFDSSPPELIAFRTDCAAGRIGAWERVTWEADTPRGTDISIDVLDEKGTVLMRDIRNGGSLASIDPLIYPSIRLQATLTTRNPQVSPVLKSWQVEYTFECQQ